MDSKQLKQLMVELRPVINTAPALHHLLKAVALTAAGILVGDVNQLPSVGPGNILGDIIDSGRVPVVRLTEIFRQARQSRIVVNAHRIKQGIMPTAEPVGDDAPDPDFYFIEQEDPERALETIVELAVLVEVPCERDHVTIGIGGFSGVEFNGRSRACVHTGR